MNCLLGYLILAERSKNPDYSWVVPVVFVAIWVLGGIGKVFGAYKEDKKRREGESSGAGQKKDMRYKPIQDLSSQSSSQRSREMPLSEIGRAHV